jgi:molecular chaperone GrpE (heat shock protein)
MSEHNHTDPEYPTKESGESNAQSEATTTPSPSDLEAAIRSAYKVSSTVTTNLAGPDGVAAGTATHIDESAPAPPPAKHSEGLQVGMNEHLEELTDEVAELRRHVRSLTRAQAELGERIEHGSNTMIGSLDMVARELARTRQDLVSERKGMALRSVFDAIIGPYQRLSAMHDALQPGSKSPPGNDVPVLSNERDALCNQIQAAAFVLRKAIRELGFEQFHAREGEPFDPQRMSACGFGEGVPGMVITPTKPGYRAGDLVALPAQVIIAKPSASAADETSSGEE